MFEDSSQAIPACGARAVREQASPAPSRLPILGLVGVGAFGEFCIPYLRDHFDVLLHDPVRNLGPICARHRVRSADLATAARGDIVVLAVPVRSLRAVAQGIAPHVKAGSLVVDVCSLKVGPLSILEAELPPHADILGTHPLFGPQSGGNGIEGLRLVLCSGRGRRGPAAARFLRRKWRLKVIETSAEQHDRQMAYVQGLTHLLARIVTSMNVPPLDHATETYSHLMRMVDMVRGDSDDLFRTILLDNPFTEDVTRSFLKATRRVLRGLEGPMEASPSR